MLAAIIRPATPLSPQEQRDLRVSFWIGLFVAATTHASVLTGGAAVALLTVG